MRKEKQFFVDNLIYDMFDTMILRRCGFDDWLDLTSMSFEIMYGLESINLHNYSIHKIKRIYYKKYKPENQEQLKVREY